MSLIPFLFVCLILAASCARAADRNFPLVWVCIPITVVGVIIVFAIAMLRPAHIFLPGATVMVARESEDSHGTATKTVTSPVYDDELEH